MAKATDAPRFLGRELIRAAAGITRDALSVVLKPDDRYTADEATARLETFMKKEVGGNGGRNMGHTK